jgi:excisionase family DNA binding protein
MDAELNKRLKNIEKMTVLAAKRMLSVKDVSLLTGFAESYVRKLVEESRLPHYRPTGKMIFFDREEIDSFLRTNRVPSTSELVTKYYER